MDFGGGNSAPFLTSKQHSNDSPDAPRATRSRALPENASAVKGVGEYPVGKVMEGRRCQAWRSMMWMTDASSSRAKAMRVAFGVTATHFASPLSESI
jgi:hypothetical protein